MDYLSYNVYIQTKKGYEKLNTTPYKIQIDPSQSSQLIGTRTLALGIIKVSFNGEILISGFSENREYNNRGELVPSTLIDDESITINMNKYRISFQPTEDINESDNDCFNSLSATEVFSCVGFNFNFDSDIDIEDSEPSSVNYGSTYGGDNKFFVFGFHPVDKLKDEILAKDLTSPLFNPGMTISIDGETSPEFNSGNMGDFTTWVNTKLGVLITEEGKNQAQREHRNWELQVNGSESPLLNVTVMTYITNFSGKDVTIVVKCKNPSPYYCVSNLSGIGRGVSIKKIANGYWVVKLKPYVKLQY